MKTAILLLAVIGVALAYQYQYEEVNGNCDNDMYDNFRGNCPYEPCSRSQCGMEGAFCRNNFCGGCHAFWYNRNGEYYHQCSNYFMNWDSNWWGNYYNWNMNMMN